MESADYNNAASQKNNQQFQNNIIFHGMNLTHHSLGSPLSTPFSQNLISSRPFNICQDFKPINPHLNSQQRFAYYQNENHGWKTQECRV